MLERRFVVFLSLFWLYLGSVPGQAQEPAKTPEELVQQAYKVTCEAAELMYTDGLLSTRTIDFEAFDPHGTRVDLPFERARYRSLFERALSVKKKATMASFHLLGPHSAQCEVHEIDSFELEEPNHPEPVIWVLDSRTRDDWVLLEGTWKLKSSHVLAQSMQRLGGKK